VVARPFGRPRHDELAVPDPAPIPLRPGLLGHVIGGVLNVGYRPALADHGGVKVDIAAVAHRKNAAVPIGVGLLTTDGLTVDRRPQYPRRSLTATIGYPSVVDTGLVPRSTGLLAQHSIAMC
jgi:hypothetical protein